MAFYPTVPLELFKLQEDEDHRARCTGAVAKEGSQ